MSQGNPNKVNAIIDEIVKNNNVFKLKSPIEQDKEKDSIAKSINSAISVLNEVGKELILQELSIDPDEKFKGFIDSVGNVDISGLSQMTVTIVKEKILEAEKEGIDLRYGQPVFKENIKTLLAEGVLTIAIIDTMIKDYDNLSEDEKDFLAQNWNNMPYEEKVNYTKALSKNLNEKSNEISNLDLKNEVNNLSQTIEGFDEHMKSVEKLSDSSLIDMITALCNVQNMQQLNLESMPRSQLIETYSNIMSGAYQELINAGREVERDLDEIKYANPDKQNEMEKDLAFKLKDEDKLHLRYAVNYAKLQAEGVIKSDELGGNVFVNLPLQLQSTILKFVQLRNKSNLTIDEFIKKPFKVQEELLEQFTSQNYIQEETKEEDKVSQEIEQLPNALVKAGFSQEEIHENFTKYIGTLKSFEIDDIENFKKWDTEIRKEQLENFLIEDGMDEKMAKILSRINFNGKLFNILGNEDQKKEFFEQFDKVINQEHIQEMDAQLDGELEEIFSQYFQDNAVDMNVSAIETQKERITKQTKYVRRRTKRI